MQSARNLVICCAGDGSDLGLDMPRCLAPVLDRPIIHWQLDLVRDLEDVTVVVGYKAAEVMRAVRDKRPGVSFVLNHDYRNTTTLDSLAMAIADMDAPFLYLDGGLLVTGEAIRQMQMASCPAIGIKQTYSDQPVCVEMGSGDLVRRVVGFTHELREYEWTGLAKLRPRDVKKAVGKAHVYQAIERVLPVDAVEIDCAEVGTRLDYEDAQAWMSDQLSYAGYRRTALAG
jgi:choline kinase